MLEKLQVFAIRAWNNVGIYCSPFIYCIFITIYILCFCVYFPLIFQVKHCINTSCFPSIWKIQFISHNKLNSPRSLLCFLANNSQEKKFRNEFNRIICKVRMRYYYESFLNNKYYSKYSWINNRVGCKVVLSFLPRNLIIWWIILYNIMQNKGDIRFKYTIYICFMWHIFSPLSLGVPGSGWGRCSPPPHRWGPFPPPGVKMRLFLGTRGRMTRHRWGLLLRFIFLCKFVIN